MCTGSIQCYIKYTTIRNERCMVFSVTGVFVCCGLRSTLVGWGGIRLSQLSLVNMDGRNTQTTWMVAMHRNSGGSGIVMVFSTTDQLLFRSRDHMCLWMHSMRISVLLKIVVRVEFSERHCERTCITENVCVVFPHQRHV